MTIPPDALNHLRRQREDDARADRRARSILIWTSVASGVAVYLVLALVVWVVVL